MSRTLLVTGASGQLGRYVAAQAAHSGWQVIGTYQRAPLAIADVDWRALEVTDQDAVRQLVNEVRPDAVVHTVINLTGPRVWPVNADGAAIVAKASRSIGARLIHMSSDAIFDGLQGPYDEHATPSPVNVYGASKAAAETVVRALVPDATIIRTSLIIDINGQDQHSQMVLDIVGGRRPESLFTDEYRCPVAVTDLTSAIMELLDVQFAGTINVAGADGISRYELGTLIAQRNGIAPEAVPSTSLAASGLRRPPDVRLNLGLARSFLTTRLRGAREFLI